MSLKDEIILQDQVDFPEMKLLWEHYIDDARVRVMLRLKPEFARTW
jgi:hypothetical protein